MSAPRADLARPPAATSVCAEALQTTTLPAARVVYRISTLRRVAFLTIDDGWYRDPALPAMLRAAHVPTTLFLIRDAAQQSYPYWRSLQAAGATVEDHTIRHPDCRHLSYLSQKQQICATAATYATVFGRRPTLFRPPYGEYNLATRQAAAACGMHALVIWDVTVNNGRLAYAYGTHLRPGDIVLIHFTRNVRTDLAAALAAARRQGLTVARLESYL